MYLFAKLELLGLMSEDTTKVTQGSSCRAQYLMVDVLQKVSTC